MQDIGLFTTILPGRPYRSRDTARRLRRLPLGDSGSPTARPYAFGSGLRPAASGHMAAGDARPRLRRGARHPLGLAAGLQLWKAKGGSMPSRLLSQPIPERKSNQLGLADSSSKGHMPQFFLLLRCNLHIDPYVPHRITRRTKLHLACRSADKVLN